MTHHEWTEEEAAVQAEAWSHGGLLSFPDLKAEVERRRRQTEEMCELNCGEPAEPGGRMCAEHAEYARYWDGLTEEERRQEHEAIDRYVIESEDQT